VFQQYKAEVENRLNAKTKRILVDRSGEYSSKQLFRFLADDGIVQLTTAPNGISESCNRSMVDPACAMMKHAGMPNSFWAEAINTAVYIKNRLPSRASPDKTAYER
jgi:transposase InsO family protein